MKKIIYILMVFAAFLACEPELKGNPDRFKEGAFEIPAAQNYGKTEIKRMDSLHIEKYTRLVEVSTDSGSYTKEITRIDTLYIKWKNSFFYTLRMKSPKTEADKDPIFVQITKVTDTSYDFSAKIGYSNFKQTGTVYKVD
jgi:hypothetical protein